MGGDFGDLESDLGGLDCDFNGFGGLEVILDGFWYHLGCQNKPKVNQKSAANETNITNEPSRGTPCEKERNNDANLSAFWVPFWSKIH